MSNKGLGVLGRLWNRFTWVAFRQERVGADEFGNVYFRRIDKTIDGGLAEKRFFKPPVRGDYDPLTLPPEWSQWLHKTRDAVPSEEDIARGIAQRELFKRRVAEFEAEDAKRRMQEQTTGSAGPPDMGAFVQQLSDHYKGDKGGGS